MTIRLTRKNIMNVVIYQIYGAYNIIIFKC